MLFFCYYYYFFFMVDFTRVPPTGHVQKCMLKKPQIFKIDKITI